MSGTREGAAAVETYFQELPGRITGALGDLGGLLRGHGKAVIDGFTSGMRSAWERGKEFVGGIAGWIRDNKGPLSYDARLLVPAGLAIIGGLVRGMHARMPALQRTVLGVAPMIQRSMASVAAGARVAGANTGAALADGLEAQARRVQAATAALAPAGAGAQISASVSREIHDRQTFEFEAIGGAVSTAVADGLDGVAIQMDSRAVVGALHNSRAGKGAFG